MVFILSCLNCKYPFWVNLVRKNKIVSLRWNFFFFFFFFEIGNQRIKIVSLIWNVVLWLIRICRIQWRCSLSLILTRNILFGQIWSKLFVESDIWYLDWLEQTELSDAVHFIFFRLEILFSGKFGTKNQNCQLKLKCGTLTILKMNNSMMMFIFSVFDREYPFMGNLV